LIDRDFIITWPPSNFRIPAYRTATEVLSISFKEAEGHNFISTNNRRNQDEPLRPYNNQEALEPGQAYRAETTTKAQGNMGNSH
jgi:hypothetical protein